MEDPSSAAIRMAAFSWLKPYLPPQDEPISRHILQQGFPYQGETIKLVGPQGIFKPRQIRHYPLSITTTTASPYNDSFEVDGNYLHYAYRGTDPQHHENRGLRDAMRDRVPLIYFFSTVQGWYVPVLPVYVIDDDRDRLRFTVAADVLIEQNYERDDADASFRRSYFTRAVRQRLHQRSFRDRVLRAYRETCSVCRLKHSRLLDAAHIVPDSDEGGEPVVSNGLTLCKIHHAAFDGKYFGIRSDYRIVVRPEILEEKDGPMLRHGLQEINDRQIIVPRSTHERPDPERLKWRFTSFAESANL